MLLKMVKGYYRGGVALAEGDTVPAGDLKLVTDELARTLIAEGFAKEVRSIPERATAAKAEAAVGEAQRKG